MILVRNIFPSLRSVLSSATFWIVAVAHSGGSIILSSGRILGSYFTDTSDGKVSIDQAGEFTAFLSLGIFLGLAVGGKSFSSLSTDGRERKNFIQRKYMMSIVMCYILSLLAIPTTRALLHSQFLVTLLQIVSTFLMGAGVAVQLYCIPAIVGTNFGANKGLYFSYTDGVAYLVGSMVWVLVAGAVAEGNPKGSGWAYGWAAIAILVILAGWLMVEFVGRYFSHEESIARREQELNAPQKQPDDRSVYIDSSQENSHEANISASQIVTL
jgi:MFS family permease